MKSDSQMLGELLAVLHRDGGHYQAEHGTEKAFEDAVAAYYKRANTVDDLSADTEQLQGRVKVLETGVAAAIEKIQHGLFATALKGLMALVAKK